MDEAGLAALITAIVLALSTIAGGAWKLSKELKSSREAELTEAVGHAVEKVRAETYKEQAQRTIEAKDKELAVKDRIIAEQAETLRLLRTERIPELQRSIALLEEQLEQQRHSSSGRSRSSRAPGDG